MSQTAQTLKLLHLILDMLHCKILTMFPQSGRFNGTIFYANGLERL